MGRLVTATTFLLLAGCSFQSQESRLQNTVSEMVALIEAGQDQKLVSEYGYVKSGEKVPSKIPDSQLKRLKAALVMTKEAEPEFLQNDTVAVYEGPQFERPLWFVKKEDRWRLMNKAPDKVE